MRAEYKFNHLSGEAHTCNKTRSVPLYLDLCSSESYEVFWNHRLETFRVLMSGKHLAY